MGKMDKLLTFTNSLSIEQFVGPDLSEKPIMYGNVDFTTCIYGAHKVSKKEMKISSLHRELQLIRVSSAPILTVFFKFWNQ